MAALTTILAGVSLAAGVGGTILQTRAQNRARSDAAARAQAQADEAREAARLEGPGTPDARIRIGSRGRRSNTNATGTSTSGGAARRNSTGVDSNRTFGSGAQTSASRIGGL